MITITANSVAELFQTGYLLSYLAIAAFNSVMLYFTSEKFFLVFQQFNYKHLKYVEWYNSKKNSYAPRLLLLCIMAFLFFCVLNVTFLPLIGEVAAEYVGFGAYLFFVLIYFNTEKHTANKIELNLTRRLLRLCISFAVLLFIVNFGFTVLLTLLAYLLKSRIFAVLCYSLLCLTPLIAPYILVLSSLINKPFEEMNNRRYIERTKKILDSSDILKIGITGSYGKTSVKNILNTLLSVKFRVLATPKSYNTPLGVSLTAKQLDATHDVFIAEMGARYKGDISDLASLVKPKMAILTGVNNQHLETMGSEEDIKNTKFELFENLNGLGFFSSDNEGSMELYEKFSGEKYSAGINGDFVKASDIVITDKGSTFNLEIKGEKPVSCNTSLLGRHNIGNICLAAAVAYKAGLSVEEIAEGINRLKCVSHRLELLKNNKKITIIDDSYNANPDGVLSALEVISCFNGRKIIITPGLVELGKDENVENYKMGKLLAKYADVVIIIGKHNAEMLIKGLYEGGKTADDIIFAKNLLKGNEKLNAIVREGDVVLFENDLPDTYN